jgi:hypothetical protein
MRNPQPRVELRVRSLGKHGWTWSYVEPENHVELYSNETYPTPEEARDWARRAYPKVEFGEDEPEDGEDGEDSEDGEG